MHQLSLLHDMKSTYGEMEREDCNFRTKARGDVTSQGASSSSWNPCSWDWGFILYICKKTNFSMIFANPIMERTEGRM